MNAGSLLLAVGGFLGTLLVTSRALGWIAGIVVYAQSTRVPGESLARGSWLAPALLHSGPWLLIVAGFGVYGVWHSGIERWYLPMGIGVALARVLFGTVMFRAHLKAKQGVPPVLMEHEPLTPERLADMRDQFVPRTTLVLTCANSAAIGFAFWNLASELPAIAMLFFGAIFLVFCFGGSYLLALFFWEMRKGELEASEFERKRKSNP
jgi:hypothetical protein